MRRQDGPADFFVPGNRRPDTVGDAFEYGIENHRTHFGITHLIVARADEYKVPVRDADRELTSHAVERE